jgi:hypothetical protein
MDNFEASEESEGNRKKNTMQINKYNEEKKKDV